MANKYGLLWGAALLALMAAPAHGASVRAVHVTPAHAAPAKPPPQLSAFDREARMSPRQMMARWQPFIAEASKRFGVPESWISAVMRIESGGRTMQSETQPITSSMGALGLMQLMPATYKEMSAQYHFGANPLDPHDNILAGAAYLRWLRGKYGYPQMFAAYNDGPGNLEERLKHGQMLPKETQLYVSSITGKTFGLPGYKAKFTRPNGAPVFIDCAAVTAVRAAMPDEFAPGVQTVIAMGHSQQGVRETPRKVRAIVKVHGGRPESVAVAVLEH